MAEKEKKEKKGFSRRSFLKGTGAVGAGIAASGPALNLLTGMDTAEAANIGNKGGYAGKILHIDLGKGHGGHGNKFQTWTEHTKKYASKLLGARGIHEWMLFNHVPIHADPLGRKNLLCLGAGPLVGTLFPGASRLEITTLNAQTGGTSHSNGGSDVCSEMKYAGYDNIIISGKAKKPSYLYIEDGKIKLRDARHIWGKNAIEARNIVRDDLGDKRICAVGIGVAGENLNIEAMITGDAMHAHGGFGCGAVMGSKNLKLICVRGHGSIEVDDPDNFKATVDPLRESGGLSPYHWLETWAGGSTLTRTLPRWRNGQWLGQPDFTPEETDIVNQKGMDDKGYTGRRYSCRHCVNANHGTFYKITDGPHEGVKSKWHMTCHKTSWFGTFDPVPITADLINWVWLVDSLGFNDSSVSFTLSWAFECYQRGLITTDDTGGIELVWPRDSGTGNNEVIFQALEDTAHRRGKLGKLLADGAWQACKKLLAKDGGEPRVDVDGHTPEYYICGTKKPNVVCKDQLGRGERIKWDIGNVVAIRGGVHSDASAGSGPNPDTLPGGPTGTVAADMANPSEYKESGRFLSYNNALKEVYDSTGQCLWGLGFSHNRVEVMATALNYATGSSYTEDSLIHMGRKLFNIAKAINTIRKGFTRELDTPLPRRLESLPVWGTGPNPNSQLKLDIDKWNEQLDRYYEFHGWDEATSWQKGSTLLDLGLPGVAWELWKEGKLK